MSCMKFGRWEFIWPLLKILVGRLGAHDGGWVGGNHTGLGDNQTKKNPSTNCNLAWHCPLPNGQAAFLLVHFFCFCWELINHVWRKCPGFVFFAESEHAGTIFTAFTCLWTFRKEDKHLRSEKPQFFSWPFIGKEGMLLHEIAKNLLKPRRITS